MARPVALRCGWLPRALLLLVAALPLSAQTSWPGEAWEIVHPSEVGLDEAKLAEARDYALKGEGSGFVVRHGKLVYSWGDPKQTYDLKSSTKSIGATAFALAISDGKLNLDQKAVDCLPSFAVPPEDNRRNEWRLEVTLFHLATQTAGFDKPGGFERIRSEPGRKWAYSDGGPNWLADCITTTYRRDIEELMFERVFDPLGITHEDLRWRENAYRPHQLDGVARREFGSGVRANVDAMARIGLLWLHGGEWRGRRILPATIVERASRPSPELVGLPIVDEERYPKASDHYGFLWWNNGDGTIKGVPRDAFWSWGLYDSLIVIIPSLDLVVARAGKSFGEEWGADYSKLSPLLRPIVAATGAPYPPSPVVSGVSWASKDEIVRKAEGSDNWPATWGDDDAIYTAYGDGWGFEPKIDTKLSLGFARVSGGPDDPHGENIRSETGEKIGQGPAGEKASGMLMVDGVLYMWVRNASNARLASSHDRGKSWQWADWKLSESFGAPTFLNFGKNYAGARDEYVYVYSHDADSAYEAADGAVLARVLANHILERGAYDFFAGVDGAGRPRWTADVAERKPVFRNPGRAYRSSISYNAGLKRYLLCQIVAGDDTRFEGGFGIYDAPEPWGPWTTVFYADKWDVGPGETCGFPTKWMSEDGRTIHMLFSGDDFFSVRRAELQTR